MFKYKVWAQNRNDQAQPAILVLVTEDKERAVNICKEKGSQDYEYYVSKYGINGYICEEFCNPKHLQPSPLY